jgi:hypothetical protein
MHQCRSRQHQLGDFRHEPKKHKDGVSASIEQIISSVLQKILIVATGCDHCVYHHMFTFDRGLVTWAFTGEF